VYSTAAFSCIWLLQKKNVTLMSADKAIYRSEHN